MTWGDRAAEQHEQDQPREHYVVYKGERYDVPTSDPGRVDDLAAERLERMREIMGTAK